MSRPNANEYEIAQEYCLQHELNRPQTNISTAAKCLVLFELLVVTLSVCVYFVLIWRGIETSFKFLYFCTSALLFAVCLKHFCVMAIELYQRYASEAIRRKCVLMPSCSEYALQALHKYNVFKALYKIFTRLTQKCHGAYQIDYP